MTTTAKRLTERQRRFIEGFAASGVGTDAARLAGYSHPDQAAYRLLKNPIVAAAIAAVAGVRAEAAIADREERQRFLTQTMRDTKIIVAERLRACDLLARMDGNYLERRELTGRDGGPLDLAMAIRGTSVVTIYMPDNGRGDAGHIR